VESTHTDRRLKPSLAFYTLFFKVWVELSIDLHKILLSEWKIHREKNNKCSTLIGTANKLPFLISTFITRAG